MAAEAVALGASIAAFIQLAERIVAVTQNVFDSTADMPTTLRMAHAETSALRDILGDLKPKGPGKGVFAEAIEKPLESCHWSMKQLEAELVRLSLFRHRMPK